jgi:hypothetical protein
VDHPPQPGDRRAHIGPSALGAHPAFLRGEAEAAADHAAAETILWKTFPPEPRPFFAEAYRKRRCMMPIDGFFEWKAVKGAKLRQPYAIAMKDGAPFGLAGLWENWRDPASGEWLRTFCIVTTRANALVREIHSRMPAILAPADYERWLSDEDDPRDLLKPYPAEPMTMWPVSTRRPEPDRARARGRPDGTARRQQRMRRRREAGGAKTA